MSDPKPFFTKEEIKQRVRKLKAEFLEARDPKKQYRAEMNMALLIASSSLFFQRVWSGQDYATHYLDVAMHNTDAYDKKIIGILHDVVEDSDWTLQDLRDVGFSERIIKGIDGVTKREGESYFSFIVRCGLSGSDAIDVKLKDLKNNLDSSRLTFLPEPGAKSERKRLVYIICYNYLVEMKKRNIKPGTSIPHIHGKIRATKKPKAFR